MAVEDVFRVDAAPSSLDMDVGSEACHSIRWLPDHGLSCPRYDIDPFDIIDNISPHVAVSIRDFRVIQLAH
jgi:hypothetical protein